MNIDYGSWPSPHTRDGLQQYVENGIGPGSFLSDVLRNDLKGAIMSADHINVNLLFPIVGWLYNNAPGMCWGSKERFDDWCKAGGLVGHRLENATEDEGEE